MNKKGKLLRQKCLIEMPAKAGGREYVK